MKTLIAYFSRIGENVEDNEVTVLTKGNTEIVAEKIKDLTGGDLYKIEEVDIYPYSYRECSLRARKEYESNEHPELKDKVGLDMSVYDTIYIGFPIWYRSYPRVVSTFLEKYDFTGKKVKPFCTNDEGFFGISLLELQSALPTANIANSIAIRGCMVKSSDERIKKFVEE